MRAIPAIPWKTTLRNRQRVLSAAVLVTGIWAQSVLASNLANPAGMTPPARISIGASYHMGGYTITDSALAGMLSRFHARVAFAPLEYFAFGIDLGASKMDVDSLTIYRWAEDEGTHYVMFTGSYGFSGGLHIKGATPRFVGDLMSFIAIVQATYFTSSNSAGAEYNGFDGAGALGLQFKIPKFGFVTAGAKLYYIEGDNRSYDGREGTYSNSDNLAGWLAVDFTPSFKQQVKGKPYFSAEATLIPGHLSAGGAIPFQGFTFSLAVGWISPRLYGEDFEDVE